MCDDCGCGDPNVVAVEVHESLLADNARQAAHNRASFAEYRVTSVNLMGSPGGGKTALLEVTARAWQASFPLAAVSGDLATDNDAVRLRRAGVHSQGIATKTACHLDAQLLHSAMHAMEWQCAPFFFIENVGNLVCPAIYDLGQAANVVVLSVTEGVDKPLKYPVMFRAADLVVVSKIDLLPHLQDVSLAAIEENLARVMPRPRMLSLSAVSGKGVQQWLRWLTLLRRQAFEGVSVVQDSR